MNKKIFSLFSVLFLMLPIAKVFAANPLPNPWIVAQINMIIGFVWYPFLAVVIAMFMYAGFSFLTANGEPTKIASARKAVIWGVVGVGVAMLAFSIVSLVSFALGTFSGFSTPCTTASTCPNDAMICQCSDPVNVNLCPNNSGTCVVP